MSSLQTKICDLDTFFDVQTDDRNGKFHFNGVDFQNVQVVHIFNNYTLIPSFGLMFETPNGKKVFYTADTQDNPKQMMDWYKQADLIFHDCELYPGFESGVHAHFDRLKTLPDEVKAKMYLMHYQDELADQYDSTGNGFKGFVTKGQQIEID